MKTKGWLRALNIVFGLVCVLLSTVVLAYPGLGILTLILILALALLVVGLARIIGGVFAEYFSNRLRAINVGAGLLEIVVTITTMLYPQYITQTLIQLLSFALLVHGTTNGLIGRFADTLPSLLRGLFVVVGLLSIILSVAAFLSIPIGFLTSVYVLSIGYLSTGIAEIILGITGMKGGQINDLSDRIDTMGEGRAMIQAGCVSSNLAGRRIHTFGSEDAVASLFSLQTFDVLLCSLI